MSPTSWVRTGEPEQLPRPGAFAGGSFAAEGQGLKGSRNKETKGSGLKKYRTWLGCGAGVRRAKGTWFRGTEDCFGVGPGKSERSQLPEGQQLCMSGEM